MDGTHIFKEEYDGAEIEVQYEYEHDRTDPELSITHWRQVGAQAWLCYSHLDASIVKRWEYQLERLCYEAATEPPDWSNARERYAA